MSDEAKRTKSEEAVMWFECQNKLSKCDNDPTPLPNHIVKIMEYNSTAITAIQQREAAIAECEGNAAIKEEDDWGEYSCGLMDGRKQLANEILEILEDKV